jgi:hypothetical protein
MSFCKSSRDLFSELPQSMLLLESTLLLACPAVGIPAFSSDPLNFFGILCYCLCSAGVPTVLTGALLLLLVSMLMLASFLLLASLLL